MGVSIKPVKIDILIFLSRRYEDIEIEKCGKKIKSNRFIDEYDALAVSPEDFREFLKSWIGFLGKLDLSSVIVITQENITPLLESDAVNQ